MFPMFQRSDPHIIDKPLTGTMNSVFNFSLLRFFRITLVRRYLKFSKPSVRLNAMQDALFPFEHHNVNQWSPENTFGHWNTSWLYLCCVCVCVIGEPFPTTWHTSAGYRCDCPIFLASCLLPVVAHDPRPQLLTVIRLHDNTRSWSAHILLSHHRPLTRLPGTLLGWTTRMDTSPIHL